MQKTKRRVASLGLAAGLLSLRCVPPPVFPAESRAVVLPLRDPLLGPEPTVLATLPGPDGPWSAWMFPDSGAAEAAVLPPASVARLGPAYADRGATHVRFVTGPWQDAREGVLSSLALGDLVVRDLPVKVTRLDRPALRGGIFGQGILGHAPWEIDWDRGTLTLGATPWPEGPGVIVVPLRRRFGRDVVAVQVGGHLVDMFLDTGAPGSTIPVGIATDAGLSDHPVDWKKSPTGRLISGDTELGPLRLGRIDFVSISDDWVGYGLLGLDVLSRYRIQVVPGERLALRPRGDPWETAPQRIARWPWTRACPTLGCVRAHVEPAGDETRVVFSFEVDVPQPVVVLLGCRQADPVGSHLPSVAERISSGRASGPWYHIAVSVASASKDQTGEAIVFGGNGWLSRTGCRDLSVLDVVPSSLDRIQGDAVSAVVF